MRAIPELAIAFVARHEGCVLRAYRDAGGVLTVGYGSTAGVTPGLVITKDEARARLVADLTTAGLRLEQRIGVVIAELTDQQYAALLSFVFNVGAGPAWTIWKRLRTRQFDQVPLELMKFVNVGGRKVRGLVARRAEECKLWATGEPGTTARRVPSSVSRANPTPPTPADPHPPQRSVQILTLAGTAAATTTAAVGQVSQTLAPYAAASDLVRQLVSALAVVAAMAATMGLILAWAKTREARG